MAAVNPLDALDEAPSAAPTVLPQSALAEAPASASNPLDAMDDQLNPLDSMDSPPASDRTAARMQDVTDQAQMPEVTVSAKREQPDSFWSNAAKGVKDTGYAAAQGLGGAFNRLMGSLGTVTAAPAVIFDAAKGLATKQPSTAAQDWWFRTFVDPTEEVSSAFALNKDASFHEKAAAAAGNMLGTLSQLVLTGPEGTELSTGATGADAARAAVEHGMKAMAVPAVSDAVQTGKQVYQETGDSAAAVKAAQTQYLVTSASGILPLSAPGKFATRVLTGAASGVATGEIGRTAMNAALPDDMTPKERQIATAMGTPRQDMQQPFSMQDVALNALAGALMGGVSGPRARKPTVLAEHTATGEGATTAPEQPTAEQSAEKETKPTPQPSSAEHAALLAMKDKSITPPQADLLEKQGLIKRNDLNEPVFLPAGRRRLAQLNQENGREITSTLNPTIEATEKSSPEITPQGQTGNRLTTDQDLRDGLTAMKSETGWAQEGGRVIRDATTDEVTGRTSWIPNAEWWPDRPKGLTEPQVHAAVDKALAGEPLKPRDQSMVDFMTQVHDERVAMNQAHAELREAAPDLDQQPEGALDLTLLIHRAGEHDTKATAQLLDSWNDDKPETLARVHSELQSIIAGGSAKLETPGRGTEEPTKAQGAPQGQEESFQEALERARTETHVEPTDGQKEAGNYRKGRLDFAGMPVAIENPKGSTRSGVNAEGEPWSRELAHDYGYFTGTKGADGDAVDTFLTGKPDTGKMFAINQIDPKTGKFDEVKVVAGADSAQEAEKVYRANYPKDWKGLGSMAEMPTERFKQWLDSADTHRPVRGAERIDRREDVQRRAKVTEMTPEQMRQELLTHELTGIPNRRAYQEAEKLPHQVAIDVDSLKWINDELGHSSGDEMLKAVAIALSRHTDHAFHISGDEFAAQAHTETEAHELMDRVQDHLKGAQIEVTMPDGRVVELKGFGVSYGVGKNAKEADVALSAHKARREVQGERAARGQAPPGATVRARQAGRQDHQDHASTSPEEKDLGPKFARRFGIHPEDDVSTALAKTIARSEGAFRYPISKHKELADVVHDIDPDLTVRKLPKEGLLQEYYISGRTSEGGSLGPAVVTVNDDGLVEMDISLFKSGQGGSGIYQAVGDFAHNNGLKFIGDRLGLSPEAQVRRSVNMLSSALRHGTTRHLGGHQLMEYPEVKGVEPLNWREGDDAHNIRQLTRVVRETYGNLVPEIKNIRYSWDHGRFEDIAGNPVTDRDFELHAERARERPLLAPWGERSLGVETPAGGRTLKAVALLQSGLPELHGQGLARLGEFLSKPLADLGLDKLFYSRGANASPGLPRAQVERIVHQTVREANLVTGFPHVEVHQDTSTLPQRIQDIIAREGAETTTGAVYDPSNGRIHLIADNNGSDREVRENLWHEAVGHHGLRLAMDGPQYNAIMDGIARDMPERVEAAAQRNGLDLSDPQQKRAAAEEVIAYAAGQHLSGQPIDKPVLPYWKRAVRAVKSFFARMTGKPFYDDKAIVGLIKQARQALKPSEDREGSPMFSRRQQELPLEEQRERDALAGVRRAVNAVSESVGVRDVRKLINPVGMSQESRQVAQIAREALGKLAHETVHTQEALEQFSRVIDKTPIVEQLAMMDAIEKGEPQPNPEMQPVADAMRKMLDDWRGKVQGLGSGYLDNFIENYFPHYWRRQDEAQRMVASIMGRRPLRGPASFLKMRTIPSIKEGMEAGLTPLTTNPLIMTLLKTREMQRFVTGVTLMRRFKEDGLAKFLPAGHQMPDGWGPINDNIAKVRSWSEEENGFIERGQYIMPLDAARVINNHVSASALRDFAPAQIFRRGANALNAMQLGFSAFHLGFTTLDAMISKNAQGTERLLHGEVGRAVTSFAEGATPVGAALNIRRGYKLLHAYTNPAGATPEMQQLVLALEQGGGRAHMDRYYQAAEGVSPFRGVGLRSLAKDVRQALTAPQDKLENLGRALGSFPIEYSNKLWRGMQEIWKTTPAMEVPVEVAMRIVRASTSWIMEHLVPMQKLGVFSDLAADHLRRNPTQDPNERAVAMQRIWDSVDNRLGEMVYDNLFWNRTLKDSAHLGIRAVGWNVGTIREIGGAPVDVVKAVDKLVRTGKITADDLGHRIPYVLAMASTTALYAAIYQYLSTGQGPQELKDYFFPKSGGVTNYGTPQRVSLPSYVKDVYEYSQRPGQTIVNKLNPIFSLIGNLYSNQDFFGNPISDPEASYWHQKLQQLQFAGHEMTPFSLQGRQQMQATEQPSGFGAAVKKALPMIGITPAPGYITSSEQIERRERLEADQKYTGELKYKIKKALMSGDKATAADLTKQYVESVKRMNQTRSLVGQDKAKAAAARRKTAISMRQAGYPATADLVASLPLEPDRQARDYFAQTIKENAA